MADTKIIVLEVPDTGEPAFRAVRQFDNHTVEIPADQTTHSVKANGYWVRFEYCGLKSQGVDEQHPWHYHFRPRTWGPIT